MLPIIFMIDLYSMILSGIILFCLNLVVDSSCPAINTYIDVLSKSMTKYYDSSGAYVAYSTDGKNLFNDETEHIGYFSNGFLYSIKGEALGHIKEKKILDKNGQTIYYTK